MTKKFKKSDIELVEYEAKYKDDLKSLSYEWLNKYNLYEDEDELILNNPEEYILKKGGYIFFARYQSDIIATFSLIPGSNNIFELAKLAVTEEYQGKGIAKILIEKAISIAKREEAEKIILYSNSKLKKAYKLYKKYGFYDINVNESKYETADVKMELDLKNN